MDRFPWPYRVILYAALIITHLLVVVIFDTAVLLLYVIDSMFMALGYVLSFFIPQLKPKRKFRSPNRALNEAGKQMADVHEIIDDIYQGR